MKKTLFSIFVLSFILIFTFSKAIVKKICYNKYSFISNIESVEIGLSKITFKNVKGNKNGKVFNFNNVTYYPLDGAVYILGGDVSLSIKNKQISDKISNIDDDEYNQIVFDNILMNVDYFNHNVKIINASGTLNKFSASIIKIDNNMFLGEDLVVDVIKKSFTLANASFNKNIKNYSFKINLYNLYYEDSKVNVGVININDFLKLKKSLININEETIQISKLNLDHDWVNFEIKDILIKKNKDNLNIDFDGLSAIISIEDKSVKFSGTCSKVGEILQLEDSFIGEINGEASLLKSSINVKSTCSFDSCINNKRIKEFNSSFKYFAYKKDKVSRAERISGPSTVGFVRYQDLPVYIPGMFSLLEDPAFMKHNGVIIKALENSLKDNLASGRFVRGGSTITMQLVKNIWLDRDKNLTRKAKEIMLAWSLEKCTTKQRIMETYLNVVEFGPDVYGITEGASYHFNTTPDMLEPIEAFYLATILPRPTRAPKGEENLDRARNYALRRIETGYLSKEVAAVLGLNAEELNDER